MGALGVNLPNHGEYRDDAKAVGAKWVRLVLEPDLNPSNLCQMYRQAGFEVLAVLARESFAGDDWAQWANTYAKRHGNYVSAWQIGNEPDHVSDSSWTLTQDEYAYLLKETTREILRIKPDAVIVGAGGASGDPNYFKRGDILRHLDAVAVHPYGQDGDRVPAPTGNFGKASDLIGRYAELGLPVWVTEFGTDSKDDRAAAAYIGDLTAQFKADSRVRVATHFCTYDGQVPGAGFGLFNVGGVKPQGVAFKTAATGSGGGMATLEERVAQLERQQSLQSDAISKMLSDHYADGANSAKGLLVQLNPDKYENLAVVEKQDLKA